MKSIHVRFEDNVYDKLKKEAKDNSMSMQELLYKKVTNSEVKSDKKSIKIQQENKEILKSIHQDLVQILYSINQTKAIINDKFQDNNSVNITILELKKDILSYLKKIQSKLV